MKKRGVVFLKKPWKETTHILRVLPGALSARFRCSIVRD